MSTVLNVTASTMANATLIDDNVTETYYVNEELLPMALEYCLQILYTIVATVGIISNGGIVYLFVTKAIKMAPFKLLLLNLSVADMLCAFSLWPYIFIDLKSLRGMHQKQANMVCAIIMGNMTYWIGVVVSTFTLTLISISRYLFVCHPLRATNFNKMRVSVCIVCLVWPTAIAIGVPALVSFAYDPKYAVCNRKWPKSINGAAYSATTSFLGFVFPVGILCFTLIATRKYFWRRTFGAVSRSPREVRRHRKTAKFMAALIAAFFISWGPFFFYWLLSRSVKTIFPKGAKGEYARMKVLRFVILISLCNTVADPFIYGQRGDPEFKRIFRKIMDFICCRQRQESDFSVTMTSTSRRE